MNNRPTALGVAIVAALGTSAAEALTYNATLVSVATYSGNGSSLANIASSNATWSYDDITGLLTQTGGTYNARFTIVPSTTLFRQTTTGLVLGNGGAATATTYACVEGNFGGNVGASLCGNYNFGANFTNESTATWGPGTTTSRTIGGDDMALGTQQDITAFNGFAAVSWVGTTLILSNASCNPFAPGNANSCATVGGFNTGQSWTLNPGEQIPLPATAWLFGPAMLAAGRFMRRRKRG